MPGPMNAFSITDESLRRLYLYLDEKRGARAFPARRDIDPLDFPYLLGWILLLDVSHAPLRSMMPPASARSSRSPS